MTTPSLVLPSTLGPRNRVEAPRAAARSLGEVGASRDVDAGAAR